MQTITVAIAGQKGAGLAFCKRFLQQESDTKVVQATNCKDVMATVRKFKPDVLVCNFEMCTGTDYPLLLELCRECPATRVILLADGIVEDDRLIHALALGVRGYLANDDVPRHLAKAVRGVDQGEAWVPRKMLGKLVALASR